MGGTPSRPPVVPDTIYMDWCKDSTTDKYLPIYVDQGDSKFDKKGGSIMYAVSCSNKNLKPNKENKQPYMYLYTIQQHMYNPDTSAYAYALRGAAAAASGAKAAAKALSNNHARRLANSKDPEKQRELAELKAAQAATRKRQLNALGAAARAAGQGAYAAGQAAYALGAAATRKRNNGASTVANSEEVAWRNTSISNATIAVRDAQRIAEGRLNDISNGPLSPTAVALAITAVNNKLKSLEYRTKLHIMEGLKKAFPKCALQEDPNKCTPQSVAIVWTEGKKIFDALKSMAEEKVQEKNIGMPTTAEEKKIYEKAYMNARMSSGDPSTQNANNTGKKAGKKTLELYRKAQKEAVARGNPINTAKILANAKKRGKESDVRQRAYLKAEMMRLPQLLLLLLLVLPVKDHI